MKALSIIQPWAWLIAAGYKDIENRTWHTYFRGEFFIHASKRFDLDGYLHVALTFPDIKLPPSEDLPKGGIVGMGKITGCTMQSRSPWFEGPYGFMVQDAKQLPFVPLRGQLGFFNVEISQQYKGVSNAEEKRT